MAFPAYTIRMLAGGVDSTHTTVSEPVPVGSRWVVREVIFGCTSPGNGASFLLQIPGVGFLSALPATAAGTVTQQALSAAMEAGETLAAQIVNGSAFGTIIVTGYQLSLT